MIHEAPSRPRWARWSGPRVGLAAGLIVVSFALATLSILAAIFTFVQLFGTPASDTEKLIAAALWFAAGLGPAGAIATVAGLRGQRRWLIASAVPLALGAGAAIAQLLKYSSATESAVVEPGILWLLLLNLLPALGAGLVWRDYSSFDGSGDAMHSPW